jgi:hypothetical protein
MRFSRLLVFIYFFLFPNNSFAQNNFTLSGIVTDSISKEQLAGVSIIENNSKTSTLTDANGFYSLSLPKGEHALTFTFVGYKKLQVIANPFPLKLDIQLSASFTELENVVVLAEKVDANVSSTEVSIEKLSISQIELIPIIMGETDILKTIQLLPGINSVAEGRAGFVVRGGGLDQNLMLMDEMPLYYASHMQGLYSVFNSAAVSGLTVYKGGIPARFGGRSSSVLDVRMVEGSFEKMKGEVSLGLITSKFALETPVLKNKLSVFVAGRATQAGFGHWYDQLNKDESVIITKGKSTSNKVFFNPNEWWYDLNSKVIYKINNTNQLSFSGYLGRDNAITVGGATRWGNTAAHLKWSKSIIDKIILNTSLVYSQYRTHSVNGIYDFASSIGTYIFKQELSYFPSNKHKWRIGWQIEYQDFNHGSLLDKTQDDGGKFMPPMQGLESAIYAENEHEISTRLSAHYGLRLSMYNRLGRGKSNVYDPETNVSISSTYFSAYTDIIKTYLNPEPRISVVYKLSNKKSIKASYNRNAQYLRLMTLGSDITWYDIWMPSTENIKPMLTDQVALGYFQNFLDNKIEFSTEAYYKIQNGASDFEDGLHNYLVNNLEAFVAQGIGRAYGLELSLEKPKGDFTSRISYNLGKSVLKIDVINQGRWYNSQFDITHSINSIASYKLSKIEPLKDFTISMNFVYYTGRPITLPESYYYLGGVPIPYWEGRNGYSLPNYHRLDLGLKYIPAFLTIATKNPERKLRPQLDISLYNVYNRRNVFTIDFYSNAGEKAVTPAKNVFSSQGRSTFGFIPSFQLTLKF